MVWRPRVGRRLRIGRGLPRTSTLEGQGRGKIKSRKGEKGEIRTGTTSAKGEQSSSCRKGGKGENSEGGTGANSRYRRLSNRSNRRLYRYRRRTNKRSNVQAKVFKSSLDRVTRRGEFSLIKQSAGRGWDKSNAKR